MGNFINRARELAGRARLRGKAAKVLAPKMAGRPNNVIRLNCDAARDPSETERGLVAKCDSRTPRRSLIAAA